MQRRRRVLQGMKSPLDSMRDNYEKGREAASFRNGQNKAAVNPPRNVFPGRYYEAKDTEDI